MSNMMKSLFLIHYQQNFISIYIYIDLHYYIDTHKLILKKKMKMECTECIALQQYNEVCQKKSL